MEDKVARIRAMIEASVAPSRSRWTAGSGGDHRRAASRANVFVAGTALYRHPEGLSAAVSGAVGKAEAAFAG